MSLYRLTNQRHAVCLSYLNDAKNVRRWLAAFLPDAWENLVFRDRDDAGHQLAVELRQLELVDPLVLAIPRGGVAIGAVLARELGAELDVVLSRKLRCPGQPELAIGAIAEDGTVYLNPETQYVVGLDQDYLSEEREYQLAEIRRRSRLIRAVRPSAEVRGRTVIVTDDGLATGSTMIAALDVVRSRAPREVIAALPVAPPNRLEPVRQRCDRIICLATPADFWAIGQFYDNFDPVEDDTVVRLLQEFVSGQRETAAPAPRH